MNKNKSTDLNKYLNPIREFVGKMPSLKKNDKVYLFNDAISWDTIAKLEKTIKSQTIDTLYFILNSPGGSLDYAYEAAYILNTHCTKVVGLFPYGAFSASTLLALSFDELRFGTFGHLGPTDVQTPKYEAGEGYSQNSCEDIFKAYDVVIAKVMEAMDQSAGSLKVNHDLNIFESFKLSTQMIEPLTKPILSKIDPKVLGEHARARDLSLEYGIRILRDIRGFEKYHAKYVAGTLAHEYPSHGFRIKADEVREMGLNVQKPNEDEVHLMSLVSDLLCNVESFQGFLDKPVEPNSKNIKKVRK